jgi:hypothetical protein
LVRCDDYHLLMLTVIGTEVCSGQPVTVVPKTKAPGRGVSWFVLPLTFSLTTESALALQKRSDEQVHGRAHQVVDRGDQRARGDGGILLQLIEQQRLNRAHGRCGGER